MQTLRFYEHCLRNTRRFSSSSSPSSLNILSCARSGCSNRTAIPSSNLRATRRWDPNEVYPSEPGQVRLTGITLRDESLNRIDLIEKAAALVNKIRPPGMKFPGHEEIGEGTAIDFPFRFNGENSLANMKRISVQLANTPKSCLIRADSVCGYSIIPKDVARKALHRYVECGVDIFRILDAYNNVANHATCAEAVLEEGKHYQAAIDFERTQFNRQSLCKMAKELGSLGAHSICVQDASPGLMRACVETIKDAVPELPVIIRADESTMGEFSARSCLSAVKAGASGVDCAIGRHPDMEVLNEMLVDNGYDLGWDPLVAAAAMRPVADLYREFDHSGRYEVSEMKMTQNFLMTTARACTNAQRSFYQPRFAFSEMKMASPPPTSASGDWAEIKIESWRNAVYSPGSFFEALCHDTTEFIRNTTKRYAGTLNDAILIELGSGTGDALKPFYGEAQFVVGTDINEQFLKYSSDDASAKAHRDTVKYMYCDMENLSSTLEKDSTVGKWLSGSSKHTPPRRVLTCVGNTMGIIPPNVRQAAIHQMAKMAGNDGVAIIAYWNAKEFPRAVEEFYGKNPQLCGDLEGADIDFDNGTLKTKTQYSTKWTRLDEAVKILKKEGMEVLDAVEKGVGVLVAFRAAKGNADGC